jgi:Trk K+ transport system NAD-binding subunit
VDLGLPPSIIIAMVERNNKYFIADGSTRIYAGDRLYVMGDDNKSMEKFYAILGKK